jgi:hypothetical protein
VTQYEIPEVNWLDELASALKKAKRGDAIIVSSVPRQALARLAAQKMGKSGLDIRVVDELDWPRH